jgi:hypothetical protein
MPREFSGMSARDIRDTKQCSLQEAVTLAKTSRLLDQVEAAETVEELRSLLAQFITMQTGIN